MIIRQYANDGLVGRYTARWYLTPQSNIVILVICNKDFNMKSLVLTLLLAIATSSVSAMPVKWKVYGYKLYSAYQAEYKKQKEDLNGIPLVGEWVVVNGRPANRLTKEYVYLGRCMYYASSNPENGACTDGLGYPSGLIKLVDSMITRPAIWDLPTAKD